MAPISRRVFLKSGAALLGVGAFTAACGAEVPNTPPTSQAAPAPSAVPAASSDPVPALLRSGNGEEEYFNKAIDLFEKQNPSIKINRIFVPGGADYTT